MTTDEAEAPAPLNVLDAACVLFFTASGQLRLLLEILAVRRFQILLPQEVLDEARAKAGREGWSLRDLEQLLMDTSSAIRVIPSITAEDPEALALYRDVRNRHPHVISGATSFSSTKDIGECVVIAHAIMATRRNLNVVVSIDDLRAQKLADNHGLKCFTVEDAISLAVEHDLLNMNQARDAYNKMARFGDSLPAWETELRTRLRREKAQRKRLAKEQQ